jgi:N-acetylmuramoyl-L-alanine amidase
MLMFFSPLAGPWSGKAYASTSAYPTVILNGQRLAFEVPPIIDNGRTLVPLRAIFESMGAKVYWNAVTDTVTAIKGTTRVVMPLYSTKPTINGVVHNIDVPTKIVNNRALAPLRFVCEAFGGSVIWNGNTQTIYVSGDFSTDPGQTRDPIVVLDPGHGGSDTGALGSHLYEKDANLKIALKVGALLQQSGIQVEYTRTTDSYVGLEQRSKIANQLNAAVFVSIHMNSFSSPEPSGTETYFYAPSSNEELWAQREERAELARCLQTALTNALQRPNRGVKEANLSVLRNTLMPSALAEVVFISNPTEEALLQTEDFQNRAAAAIANGIITYMTK